ncbi:thyrotropin-releasing hormone receptor-like [Patiria miniata]|uniref:G-protein coupled receptors family 1 profile domain-containing protein n=1 Tax=Patiria miniata TaxID=46514 RepID=A0A914A249_PATMI|nr:thyrotropin-releasing hormone receptor-like [Patiria miniata]
MDFSFLNWTVANGSGHFIQHGQLFGTFNLSCDTLVFVETEEEVEQYMYSPMEKIVNTYILPIIMAIGLLSNIAFLFVVARVHRMRTVVNVYLVSLAFADILFLGAAMGQEIAHFASSPIAKDQGNINFGCFIVIYVVSYIAFFTSEFLVTAVAFERFYAVCRPMKVFVGNADPWNASKLVVLSWVVAAILAGTTVPSQCRTVVYCMMWPTMELEATLPATMTAYLSVSEAVFRYASFIQTFPFFVAMAVNSVLFVRVMRAMNDRLGVIGRQAAGVRKNLEVRNQIARMLVINGVIFFLLMAPFQTLSLYWFVRRLTGHTRYQSNKQFEGFLLFSHLLTYCNSAINPIIYNVANSRYRRAFYEAFSVTCGSRCRSDPSAQGEAGKKDRRAIFATCSSMKTTNGSMRSAMKSIDRLTTEESRA